MPRVPDCPPSPASQELRQAREAQRELAAEKQSQEEQLRQREREVAALKGTMREEASSRDGELERYRRDLQQLQEERDEAAKVSVGTRARTGFAPSQPSRGTRAPIAPRDLPAQQLAPSPPRAVAALQAKTSLESAREASEQARKTVESTLREVQEQNDDLRRKVLGMETQLKEYERLGDSWEGSQTRLKEKVTKLEVPELP